MTILWCHAGLLTIVEKPTRQPFMSLCLLLKWLIRAHEDMMPGNGSAPPSRTMQTTSGQLLWRFRGGLHGPQRRTSHAIKNRARDGPAPATVSP